MTIPQALPILVLAAVAERLGRPWLKVVPDSDVLSDWLMHASLVYEINLSSASVLQAMRNGKIEHLLIHPRQYALLGLSNGIGTD